MMVSPAPNNRGARIRLALLFRLPHYWGLGGLVLLLAALWPAAPASAKPAPPPAFLAGGDLSFLAREEQLGAVYKDGGQPQGALQIFKTHGWNVVRLRLWVRPTGQGEYINDLPYTVAQAKRVKQAGLKFLLDFHYSDTWADPGHQIKPRAWAELAFPQLVQKMRDYSRETIAHLRDNGALPDMVQVGNETRNGLLYGSAEQPGGGFWEKTPGGRDRAVQLLKAGLDGVRQGAAPDKAPLTIIHIPDGQDPRFTADYFRDLYQSAAAQNIALDYDIIGLSYYPSHPWDAKASYEGWALARLSQSMQQLATAYHKPIMVVETAWPHHAWPHRGEPRQLPGAPQFPFTPEGQADYYRALVAAVKAVPEGLGIGVLPWDQDARNWDSVFDDNGQALPAVRVLGAAASPAGAP